MYTDPFPFVNVIFQDLAILVVDKPAGLPVLPDGWEPQAPYLLELLQAQHGKLWVVHRLDKITSGVLVFARSADAHRHLNSQFENHEANKVYHAILSGSPPWEDHTARHPLRMNVGHSHRTVVDSRHGKPSETHFRLLERYQGCTLVAAIPSTGRTHQVRVHAYALGYPLLGDELYSAPKTGLIQRPALHAYSLQITHPVSNEKMTFTAGYPADFQQALEHLRKSQELIGTVQRP